MAELLLPMDVLQQEANGFSMKLLKKRSSDERMRAVARQEQAYAANHSEERFHYPASEPLAEISCGGESVRWQGSRRPAASGRPHIAIAS